MKKIKNITALLLVALHALFLYAQITSKNNAPFEERPYGDVQLIKDHNLHNIMNTVLIVCVVGILLVLVLRYIMVKKTSGKNDGLSIALVSLYVLMQVIGNVVYYSVATYKVVFILSVYVAIIPLIVYTIIQLVISLNDKIKTSSEDFEVE